MGCEVLDGELVVDRGGFSAEEAGRGCEQVGVEQAVTFDLLRVVLEDGVLLEDATVGDVGVVVTESEGVPSEELERRSVVGVVKVVVLLVDTVQRGGVLWGDKGWGGGGEWSRDGFD